MLTAICLYKFIKLMLERKESVPDFVGKVLRMMEVS